MPFDNWDGHIAELKLRLNAFMKIPNMTRATALAWAVEAFLAEVEQGE